MVDKPNFIIIDEEDKGNIGIITNERIKENQLDKKTQAKMVEYIKNNSTKSLKEVIKKFYKK